MLKGYLSEKKGFYYIVYNYRELGENKRKTKWVSTKIPVKNGNKRKAQNFLDEYMLKLNVIEEQKQLLSDKTHSQSRILFSEYLEYWLETKRNHVDSNTFSNYRHQVGGVITPYFKEKQITLLGMTHMDILSFYNFKRDQGRSENTIYKYHSYLNQAFKLAVREDLLTINPMDKVTPPRKKKFFSEYYQEDELVEFLKALEGDPMETFFLITTYYGLRRSETCGLKWSSFSLSHEYPTISIRSVVVVDSDEDGQRSITKKNYTKNNSSMRTLPLVPEIRDKLVRMKEERLRLKKLLGASYPKEDDEYVFVNSMGHLLKPDYVSQYFRKFIKKNNLKPIRLHDLRHSCASLLIATDNIEMHDVQIWLGHSNYNTTANTYAHTSPIKSTKASSEKLRNLLLVDRE